MASGSRRNTPRFTQIFDRRRNRIMNNGKGFALRISAICFRIALGALIISSLVGIPRIVWAQAPLSEKVIYNFTRITDYGPTGVIRDSAGNLYVATQEGGDDGGCGNILKVTTSGKATVLYTFKPMVNDDCPEPTELTRDVNGNVYGTTLQGGQYLDGTVFELRSSDSFGTLHTFAGGNDGDLPEGGVTLGSGENLYGTTAEGGGTDCDGYGCGIIYKLTTSGTETVLYRFTGGTDGAYPEARPVLDTSGNLYGTAAGGGNLNCSASEGFGEGCGTVWKLDTSGNFTVLYSFTGGTDGATPSIGLTMDSSGNLYGVAFNGGDLSCSPPYGCGTVFEISSSGNFTVLHAFTGGPNDGQWPDATLLRDPAGNLYGTTGFGGDLSCTLYEGYPGCGAVFMLNSSGNETILHAFAGGTTDGISPLGGLVSNGKGTLYGATLYGGTFFSGGTIFQIQTQ
jgi:uncharacterized repeat protein (TIGR03803 family)